MRAPLAALAAQAELHRTPCGAGEMVWRRWGRGEPLLLLHGAQGSWTHWVAVLSQLAAERELWVPDLPGHGDSADPPAPSLESLAAVLAAGLEALPVAPPLVAVGFSFGGVVGAELARLHPRWIGRLILVGSGGLGTPRGELRLLGMRDAAGRGRKAVLAHNLRELMLARDEGIDDELLALQEENVRRARLEVASLILPDRLARSLAASWVPVDAIWGEQDRPHPDPSVQERALRALRPGLRFRVIPEAGHWAMQDAPEVFAATLLALLADTPRASP